MSWARGLRNFGVGLLIAIGCIGFGVFVAVNWVERQILNTDNWVAFVSPLPKQPVVYTALGSFISDKVFAEAPVEAKIADALPPKASFLAKPLANQLHSITTRAAQRVVASDGFQTIWTGANRIAHDRLISTARGETPSLQSRINERFNIDLSSSSGKLRGALGKASDAIPALQPAAHKAIDVSTDLKTRPRRFSQFVKTADYLNAVLPMLAIAAILTALALSMYRRHTTMTVAVVIVVIMLIELLALKGARQSVLDQVHNSANVPAVSYIFDSLISGLRSSIYIILGISVVAWLLALVSGPASWAKSLRSYTRIDRLKLERFTGWWRPMREGARKYQYYIWLFVVLVILACMAAFVTITARSATNALLLAISLCALVHIVATPRQRPRLAA